MSSVQLANYLVEDEKGVLHAYWNSDILLSDLKTIGSPRKVFRLYGGLKASYREVGCLECLDDGELPSGEWCQDCCEHGEYDHGICGNCGKDCTDDLVGAAEYAFEGER